MTKPRTLAAIFVLSALAAPALAQGAGGSDNSPPPAVSQPGTSDQGAATQGGSNTPPSAGSANPNSTAGTNTRPAGLQNPTAEVQQRLQQLGLYGGDIDGKWGPQTRSAVVEFQRSHHLQPTGTLDVATIARLNQMTQNPQAAQSNTANQEPTPNTGATGNNTAQTSPPAPRRPGASTSPGFATSPGSSTTARATITAPGPGLGYGEDTFGNNAVPGAGAGINADRGFFGSTVDLSNGYNAAVNPNGR